MKHPPKREHVHRARLRHLSHAHRQIILSTHRVHARSRQLARPQPLSPFPIRRSRHQILHLGDDILVQLQQRPRVFDRFRDVIQVRRLAVSKHVSRHVRRPRHAHHLRSRRRQVRADVRAIL